MPSPACPRRWPRRSKHIVNSPAWIAYSSRGVCGLRYSVFETALGEPTRPAFASALAGVGRDGCSNELPQGRFVDTIAFHEADRTRGFGVEVAVEQLVRVRQAGTPEEIEVSRCL